MRARAKALLLLLAAAVMYIGVILGVYWGYVKGGGDGAPACCLITECSGLRSS